MSSLSEAGSGIDRVWNSGECEGFAGKCEGVTGHALGRRANYVRWEESIAQLWLVGSGSGALDLAAKRSSEGVRPHASLATRLKWGMFP